MIPSLPITDITAKWATALATNTVLTDWCNTTFGKAPKIYVGLPKKDPPADKDCPYIVIRPGVALEGESQSEPLYAASVGWSVVGKFDTKLENGVVVGYGVNECSEMGQYVLAAIDGAGDWPIYDVTTELECADFLPQVVGFAEIQIRIPALHSGGPSY